ncbi:multiubiquitin domain-containing protein [Candidatus Nomurabacteria bacterium]|nr:multiubiquitin domain-containing protein [Candidatus Nomurabacteria bacterium]
MDNDNKEHGHEEKEVTIIVNAREKKWDKKEISYEEVIKLAFGEYIENENIVYTVAYSRAHGDKNGTLTKGESVKVKEGMVFNVNKTDKS